MLFNSLGFIFCFLPVTFFGYFVLQRFEYGSAAKYWLLAASLFFYSWWDIRYLPLLLGSVIVNFVIGRKLPLDTGLSDKARKYLLCAGVLLNVVLLAYFKYADFFISNVNFIFDTRLPLLRLILPLAISFFTLQQIGFLVDSYKGHTRDYVFLNYAVFVTFFPQLIAGPIVHHRKLVPQIAASSNNQMNIDNITLGLMIFAIGLFKKVVLADSFAEWANVGHHRPLDLGLVEAWGTSLSYTLQLYFDFSGYSDMAMGGALLFNIKLPVNFNSPYKAANIRDFWRRWHMTLGDFITRYVYGSLGASKKGKRRNYLNLFISFFVVGIWHGAGLTFVFFGLLHGLAVVLQQWWQDQGLKMSYWLGCLLTFNFFNWSVVIFRAENMDSALTIYQAMLGFQGIGDQLPLEQTLMLVVFTLLVLLAPNSIAIKNAMAGLQAKVPVGSNRKNNTLQEQLTDVLCFRVSKKLWAVFLGFLFYLSIMLLERKSEFLYFQF